MLTFDDSRLDDADALAGHGDQLRHLALAGARLRRGADATDLEDLQRVMADFRPRAIIALGGEARLIRAVSETHCPVPLVAWSAGGLPAWVGPLDLVVIVLDDTPGSLNAVGDAVRRGAIVWLVGADPQDQSPFANSRSVAAAATGTDDVLCNAIIALSGLADLELTPPVGTARVADGLDQVATVCSPLIDLGANPAKERAVCLADSWPLVWGGSTLAARAARRTAEAIRQASHQGALAADATALIPVLSGAPIKDVFADPFEEPAPILYSLVLLDDLDADPVIQQQQAGLTDLAEARGVRVTRISYGEGTAVEKYACLTQHGRYAAAYLDVGLI